MRGAGRAAEPYPLHAGLPAPPPQEAAPPHRPPPGTGRAWALGAAPPGPGPHSQRELGAGSAPPGALSEHPGASSAPPAAGSGRPGRAGVRRPQRCGPGGAETPAHTSAVTPAPPSCSTEPHTDLPGSSAHGRVGPCRLPWAECPQERPQQPWPFTCQRDTGHASMHHRGQAKKVNTHLHVLSNPISILDFLLII